MTTDMIFGATITTNEQGGAVSIKNRLQPKLQNYGAKVKLDIKNKTVNIIGTCPQKVVDEFLAGTNIDHTVQYNIRKQYSERSHDNALDLELAQARMDLEAMELAVMELTEMNTKLQGDSEYALQLLQEKADLEQRLKEKPRTISTPLSAASSFQAAAMQYLEDFAQRLSHIPTDVLNPEHTIGKMVKRVNNELGTAFRSRHELTQFLDQLSDERMTTLYERKEKERTNSYRQARTDATILEQDITTHESSALSPQMKEAFTAFAKEQLETKRAEIAAYEDDKRNFTDRLEGFRHEYDALRATEDERTAILDTIRERNCMNLPVLIGTATDAVRISVPASPIYEKIVAGAADLGRMSATEENKVRSYSIVTEGDVLPQEVHSLLEAGFGTSGLGEFGLRLDPFYSGTPIECSRTRGKMERLSKNLLESIAAERAGQPLAMSEIESYVVERTGAAPKRWAMQQELKHLEEAGLVTVSGSKRWTRYTFKAPTQD